MRKVFLILPAAFALGQGALGQGVTEPAPVVKEPRLPVRVVERADRTFFVDFGRDAFAYPELRLPGNVAAGRTITIRLGEKRGVGDEVDARPGGSIRYLSTAVTTAAGTGVYRPALTSKDARLMPREIGAVMPFRYAEIAGLPEGVTAEDLSRGAVRQVAVHYPFDDAAADFACANGRLNAIWELSKYSMKATSFGGIFVDGDRERKPYEADCYINALGWYYSTNDTALPRHSHEYLITHPTWPTEWIMFSTLTGWLDYRYSGETGSLERHYDDLKAKTLRALAREDGLISTSAVPAPVKQAIHFQGTLKDIVDWPETERDHYDLRPINTVVNAFHCRSLEVMAELAAALHKQEDAGEFRRAAERATAALNAKLVDPATGLYVDGEGSRHSSLHANMFPLAFGLAPADRREKVAAFVESRGMACSVYGAQFLLDALFANGRGDSAVKLMTAPGDRSWRHMVEDVGTTITLEAWDDRYKPNEDWNHAWGAAPANLLPRFVLGIEPLEAGYARALVWPRMLGKAHEASLGWARGKTPTPRGSIGVEWRQAEPGMRMTIDLPAGTPALLRLPADWGNEGVVDGSTVAAERRGEVLELALEPGRHTVSLGRPPAQ